MSWPSEIKSEPMWNFRIGQENRISFKIKTKIEKGTCVGASRQFQCPVLKEKGLHSQTPGKVY